MTNVTNDILQLIDEREINPNDLLALAEDIRTRADQLLEQEPSALTDKQIVDRRLKMISKAINDKAHYCDPDLTDVKALLKEVIVAARIGDGEGWIQELHERSISDVKLLKVELAWSSRGYTNSNRYYIPFSIFEQPDHILAAKVYGTEQRIKTAQAKLDMVQRDIQLYNQELATEQALLRELTGALR